MRSRMSSRNAGNRNYSFSYNKSTAVFVFALFAFIFTWLSWSWTPRRSGDINTASVFSELKTAGGQHIEHSFKRERSQESSTNLQRENAQQFEEPRHVVFIIADDWRGVPVPGVKMPRVDELRARGVSFEAAYTPYPLCNPSRASILSGRSPMSTGIFDLDSRVDQNGLNSVPSLPAFLKRHGYRTISSGKVYHGETDANVWNEVASPSIVRPFADSLCSRGSYHRGESAPVRLPGPDGKVEAILEDIMCKVFDVNRTHDMQIAYAAVRALREHTTKYQNTPCFLAVGFVSTHLPWKTARPYWEETTGPRFDLDVPRAWQTPDPEDDKLAFETSRVRGKDFTFRNVADAKRQAFRFGYRAAIAQLDAAIGIIIDAVQDLGIADHTLIVVTADHGFALGEDGHYGKRSLNEISTRVPLVVRSPWAGSGAPWTTTPGTTYKDAVSTLGLYKSIADITGLGGEVPNGIEGEVWWESKHATSQVVRCIEAICPNDLSPLSEHVQELGISLRSYSSQRWVRWVPIEASAASITSIDCKNSRTEAFRIFANGQQKHTSTSSLADWACILRKGQ